MLYCQHTSEAAYAIAKLWHLMPAGKLDFGLETQGSHPSDHVEGLGLEMNEE
jgi:hypothetical protein